MRSFKIGNVLIPGNLILGPMAGVTDLPFRYARSRELILSTRR